MATLTDRKGVVYLMPMLLFSLLEILTEVTVVGFSAGQAALVSRLVPQALWPIWGFIVVVYLAFVLLAFGVFSVLLRKRVFQWQYSARRMCAPGS